MLASRTWLVSWVTLPVESHSRRPRLKKLSVKLRLQRVLYSTPALVREPLRLSIPTKPGHWPDQFARVRMGPVWLINPANNVFRRTRSYGSIEH